MRFIKLTRILDTLTEDAEDRYIAFQKMIQEDSKDEDEDDIRDEYGRTAEEYRSMGMQVPEELKKQNGSKEYTFEFKKEDYNREYFVYLCNLERVEGFDQLEDDTTIVYYTNDREIIVKESIEEIENLINNS